MPRIGEVIAGKYRLENLVGSGGMGVVYSATHLPLRQAVAIKFVRYDPDKAEGSERQASSRLDREARAIAQLRSDHVARVHDFGVTADGDSFLVMDLLEGSTLDAVVRKQGPLSVADASECVIQACHALGEAHARGIIHRDVKPSNLFCTRSAANARHVKVIDFGIARATFSVEAATRTETRTGALLGSPPYMSPEQIHAAKHVDPRSDIWSLGVVLYYLVTGRLPFDARSLLDLMTLIAYEEPASIRSLRPETPEEFELVVHRCLRKSPDERYASVVELARDLSAFAPTAMPTVDRLARSDFEADPSSALLPSVATLSAEVAPRTRSKLAVGLGTGGLVLAAGLTVIFAGRLGGAPNHAAAASDIELPQVSAATEPAPTITAAPAPVAAASSAPPAAAVVKTSAPATKGHAKLVRPKPPRAAHTTTQTTLPTTPD